MIDVGPCSCTAESNCGNLTDIELCIVKADFPVQILSSMDNHELNELEILGEKIQLGEESGGVGMPARHVLLYHLTVDPQGQNLPQPAAESKTITYTLQFMDVAYYANDPSQAVLVDTLSTGVIFTVTNPKFPVINEIDVSLDCSGTMYCGFWVIGLQAIVEKSKIDPNGPNMNALFNCNLGAALANAQSQENVIPHNVGVFIVDETMQMPGAIEFEGMEYAADPGILTLQEPLLDGEMQEFQR